VRRFEETFEGRKKSVRELSVRRDGAGGRRGASNVLLGICGGEVESVGFVGGREAGCEKATRVETVGCAGGV